MGRRFTFLVAAGLAVACTFGIGGQMALADEVTIENVAASDWMSVLEDERYISDIAIPGTHSSTAKDFYDEKFGKPIDVENCSGGFGTRDVEPIIEEGQRIIWGMDSMGVGLEDKCRRQDMSIADQLEQGVRLLDIGSSMELTDASRNEGLYPTFEQLLDHPPLLYMPGYMKKPEKCYPVKYYYHRWTTSDGVERVTANVATMGLYSDILSSTSGVIKFLQEHPTETILLNVYRADIKDFRINYMFETYDPKVGDEPTIYAAIDYMLDELEEKGLLYRGAEIPQLKDVRGKLVLLNTPGIDNDQNHRSPEGKPKYQFYHQFYQKPWIDGGIDLTLPDNSGVNELSSDGVSFSVLQDKKTNSPQSKLDDVRTAVFDKTSEFPKLGEKGESSTFAYTTGFSIEGTGDGKYTACGNVASTVNPAIEDFVANELQPNHNIGWLLSDFVGTSLQPSTIFRTNTPLLASETDPNPDPDPNPNPDPDPEPDPEPAPAPAPAPAPTFQGHEMHRLYNPNSGEHFYTASAGERDAAVAAGWLYEGIGWTAPVPTQGIATKPVYRLYNQFAGDHHYTQSLEERNALIGFGWTYEGVGWYSGGTTPLWRQYNPNAVTGTHNYTPSTAERQGLVALGWVDEGVAWYGL